ADPSLVGRSITLNGDPYEVVAVMPRGFQLFDWESELWTPMVMDASEFAWTGATAMAFGRLRAGVTTTEASNELRARAASMRTDFGHLDGWGKDATVVGLQDFMVGDVRRMLWLLFGAVSFLLLIAAVNVANLVAVRTAERRQELAVRMSLGASTGRVARLLLTECLTLGIAGGVTAIIAALGVVRVLPSMLPPEFARLHEITLDARVVAFAVAATLVPSILLALAPLAPVRRLGVNLSVREGRASTRSGQRARGIFASVQIALTLTLMMGAALMTRTLVSLINVDAGLRTDHLLTARIQPPGGNGDDATRRFWHEALVQVEAIPGVISAATILHLPTSGRSWGADIEIEGQPKDAGTALPRSAWQSVSSKFFATAGVPLLSGRAFTDADNENAPHVTIVNSVFAQQIFPGTSPLGHRIKAGNASAREWVTIVGVVGSMRHDSLNAEPQPELYVPFDQKIVGATSLIVRTKGDPTQLASVVRGRVQSVDPNTPVSDMRSMQALLSDSLRRPRLVFTIITLFASLGLALGAIGIYGVVAYGVQQRLRELGIRAALGADAGALRGLVMRGGLVFAVAGVAAGIPLTFAVSRMMRGFVYGVSSNDPISLIAVAILMLLVAAASSWIPARRAARSDPMAALQRE
ncbi:MAG: ADOP family duplicated permease, partial [Gemmatimonadaceae bacterium]